MIHVQTPTPDWLDGVDRLPNNALVLAIDGVQWLKEAKLRARAHGKEIKTILRHWNDPYQVFPLDEPFEWYINHARGWFTQYIDGTFREHAEYVDYVKGFNEIYANSQSAEEVRTRIWWERAAAQVWANEYRSQPDYAHIRLVIGSAAVGNDMPIEIADIATRYDCVVSYHSYYYTVDGVQPEWEWANLSGRFDLMDIDWQRQGYKVDWMATESGPFESAATGWRSDVVCGQDRNCYLDSITYFLDNLLTTDAYHENRYLGSVLFTTGGLGIWSAFETSQPELNQIADMFSAWYAANPPGSVVPPPPPPPPSPGICRGHPRTQYTRIDNVVPAVATEEQAVEIFLEGWRRGKETTGGSYDDAGIGDLDHRHANLYGIHYDDQQEFIDWYDEHYPGVSVTFLAMPTDEAPPHYDIVDIVASLPTHETREYSLRDLNEITTLTIHHTVSPPDRTIASIAAYHVSRGWPGIGYHFVIDDDGNIYQTNYLDTVSYHAGSYNAPGDENRWSVGISLQGDFTDVPPPQEQQDATKWLVEQLKNELAIDAVLPHRGMPGAATACPGNTWESWFPYVSGE